MEILLRAGFVSSWYCRSSQAQISLSVALSVGFSWVRMLTDGTTGRLSPTATLNTPFKPTHSDEDIVTCFFPYLVLMQFAYVVELIKTDSRSLHFDMAYKTIQRASVPNLELFGSMKTELSFKGIGKLSAMFFAKMGQLAFFCPQTRSPQYKCMEIF